MKTISISGTKLSAIRAEIDTITLERVPIDSGRARGPGTSPGWISGLSMTRLVDPGRSNRMIEFPALASAVGALMKRRSGELYQVMVNRLDPGGVLDTHRDGIPFEPAPERWHLPVKTDPFVEYWEEGSDWVHLPLGSWSGPIRYWERHSMRNLGMDDRIHVVVDLNV